MRKRGRAVMRRQRSGGSQKHSPRVRVSATLPARTVAHRRRRRRGSRAGRCRRPNRPVRAPPPSLPPAASRPSAAHVASSAPPSTDEVRSCCAGCGERQSAIPGRVSASCANPAAKTFPYFGVLGGLPDARPALGGGLAVRLPWCFGKTISLSLSLPLSLSPPKACSSACGACATMPPEGPQGSQGVLPIRRESLEWMFPKRWRFSKRLPFVESKTVTTR